jgi:2,4-dienoyl-CoA reductase-like NADH-dependent reductase (Old Yellow Enzyme family)
MKKNSKLFEKYKLNNGVEIQSRLVAAPVSLFASDSNKVITDEERDFLKVRGKNYGLYILGATSVTQDAIAFIGQPVSLSEKDIPALSEKAKLIKANGTKAINQIQHAGVLASKEFSKLQPVGPSAKKYDKILEEKGMLNDDYRIHELTNEEINKIIQCFAYSAELSLKAGFDGVEIHGANNFLPQQFYSRHTNDRTDEWGGSDEKRMNFHIKVIDEVCKIREKFNRPDFIIGYRISPEEPFDDGITMTETLKLVKVLSTKPLQYLHISQMNFFQKARRGEGAGTERLKLIHDELKGKLPLIGCGGLKSFDEFNSAMNSGFCEFVAAGKANLLNKDLGILLKEGKADEINLELDPEHPEKYLIPSELWKACLTVPGWLPPIKGEPYKDLKNDVRFKAAI